MGFLDTENVGRSKEGGETAEFAMGLGGMGED